MNKAFPFRAAFGCWINDMRNSALPHEAWPYKVLDDEAERGILSCLDAQQCAGFNYFDVFGLFATYSWPLDIRSAVDKERKRRVQTIVTAAHDRGIKLLNGLGVYSWGFDEIIANSPEVRGPNPHAMCGSREESWRWMAKVVDYVLEEFPGLDGYHLESSDLGRCACRECARRVDAEYHSILNARTADYIRQKCPDKILMVNLCGYLKWGSQFAKEDLKYLVELSRHIDFLIDPGHHGCYYVDESLRGDLISSLHCAFGTSGDIWVYPPQRYDRLRWFLPYTLRTGEHLKALHRLGGRAVEYYMGPRVNPGVEVNVVFGGKLLNNLGRDCADVLEETVGELYQPRDSRVCGRLARFFQRAEEAYFGNWPEGWPGLVGKQVHELHLEPLFGAEPGKPVYLDHLKAAGRGAYKRELLALLAELAPLESACRSGGRVARIETCLRNTIKDIDSI